MLFMLKVWSFLVIDSVTALMYLYVHLCIVIIVSLAV